MTGRFRGSVGLACVLAMLGLAACDQVHQTNDQPRLIAPDAVFTKMIQHSHRLNEADAQAWVSDVLSSLDTVGMVRGLIKCGAGIRAARDRAKTGHK